MQPRGIHQKAHAEKHAVGGQESLAHDGRVIGGRHGEGDEHVGHDDQCDHVDPDEVRPSLEREQSEGVKREYKMFSWEERKATFLKGFVVMLKWRRAPQVAIINEKMVNSRKRGTAEIVDNAMEVTGPDTPAKEARSERE